MKFIFLLVSVICEFSWLFYCHILIDNVQTADMGTTMVPPASNSPETRDLTASPASSSRTHSGRSSAASGRVEKFLLLEAVLSFIHSAVSSVYVIWFHVHVLYIVYTHCTLRRTGRIWSVVSCVNLKKKYSRASISADSVSVVYRGPKKLEN
jgi:hypothetical protein